MRRDCILVLFLPLYLNLYTNIHKPNYLLQKYFSLKQKKQTAHQVSCQSLLNHCNFSVGLYIKQGSSRGCLQQFLTTVSFHNFAFYRTDGEGTLPPPCCKLLAQFAVEQLPIHFVLVSCMEKRNVEKSSITVSVSEYVFFL